MRRPSPFLIVLLGLLFVFTLAVILDPGIFESFDMFNIVKEIVRLFAFP